MNDTDLKPMEPGGQLRLLDEEVLDTLPSKIETKAGSCSGSKLKHYDPERYALICNLLGAGDLSQRQISRIAGVSRNLVSGIVMSQTSDIEPLKQRIAGQSRNLAQLCIERATEMVLDDEAKVSLRDLMIAAGVAVDKSQLLAGQATTITEFKPHDPGDDVFEEALRKAQAAGRVIDVPADVQPAPYSRETGTEPGELRLKGNDAGEDPDDDEPSAGSRLGVDS